MSKKIYDILPPKLVQKTTDEIQHLIGNNTKKKNRSGAGRKKNISKRFPLREILVGGSVILFLLGAYFYNTLPKADIEIWPKVESATFQETIVSDKSSDLVDISKKVIPAQYIEESLDGSQEFQATGSASNDGKATGTIKIYNKINPSSPFTLKTGTHFLSDSGKYFLTLQKVTIPAAKGGVPGSIRVSVQAEESGANYNIGASKFSAPKLSGTPYYYTIWAESSSKMEGGYTGNVKKVTKDDILEAKNTLTKKLLSQAETSLRGKLSPDDVLLDGAIFKNVIDASAAVKADAIVDTFTERAKVKVSALVFRKQDLEKFAKEYVLSQLPDSKTFLDKNVNVEYESKTVNTQDGTQTFNLNVSVTTYDIIDPNDIVDFLANKSADQIKEVVDKMYGDAVANTEVHFWPFWVHKVPSNKDRVRVDLSFAP